MAKEKEDPKDEFDEWYNYAKDGERDWRTQAEEDKNFYWSKQWDASDIAKLKKEKRPANTYNEIKPIVNFISGSERQNRIDIKVFNRTGGNNQIAEILTILIKDIEDQARAPFEYSRVFLDGLIRGKGYVGLNKEYDQDVINGNITIRRFNPFNVHFDPASEKYDKSDAEFCFTESWFTRKKLALLYPDKEEVLKVVSVQPTERKLLIPASTGDYEGTRASLTDIDRYKLLVKNCWYKKWEKIVFLFNEETGELKQSDVEGNDLNQWLEVQARNGINWRVIPDIVQPVLNLKIKVGNVVLEEMEEPLGNVNKIPIVPYFAYWDEEECQGVITDLKDPQREINKRNSQFLHILNTLAHAGWLSEEGAQVDPAKYEKFGSTPGVNLQYVKGTTKPERIEPAGVSQGHILAEKIGEDKIRKISGVNPDLLGEMATRGEPGIVLQLRQRQGNIVIEQLYDNWRNTRILIGELLLDMIQKAQTYSEEEIKNIVGREKIEIQDDIGRIMNDMTVGRYEVKVDLSATSPTIRLANFNTLVEAAKAGIPIPMDVIIEAFPDLPDKEKIMERIKQQEGGATPSEGTPGAVPEGMPGAPQSPPRL